MENAVLVWKFEAWVRFPDGTEGQRTCFVSYVGLDNPDEMAARHLFVEQYPGSAMQGFATPMSEAEAATEAGHHLMEGEVYLVG